jgi:hypothetical protein
MLKRLISAAALATATLLAALPSAVPANGGVDRPGWSDDQGQVDHGGDGNASNRSADGGNKRGVGANARGNDDARHSGFRRRPNHCSASSTDTLLGAVAGGLVAHRLGGTDGLAPRAIEQNTNRC